MAQKKTTPKKKTPQKTAKKPSKTVQKSGFFKTLIAKLFKWGFVVGLWFLIGVTILMAWYASELPSVTKSMVFERRPTVIIKASDGSILDRYGDVKGKIITIQDLPPHVVNAVIATEDRRFYKHFGFDIVGFARAMVVNIRQMSFVQGGSTITQQLAKNLFLSRERTIKRKIQELMLSFWLERELTKDEILSAYLNRVYLGAGAYGIDAAANVYFGKSATELSVREAATIAGLLKAPSRFSPASNPHKSAERTKVVLGAMVDAGYIDQATYDQFAKLPPSPRKKPSSGDTIRYFTDYVVSQLNDLIGNVESDIIVETTLNKDIQEELEESMTKALLQYGSDKNVEQGAGIVIRLDGAVSAMMGGRDYGDSEFNRVTNSLRPPGSSFKPIVYLTAIEEGWQMSDTIIDEPIRFGRYRPQNYGHEYYGEVTLYEALTMSLNTVAVNLMRDVSPTKVIDMARRLGVTADLEEDLSLALGSSGVPMIQMATAYATLGRGGLAVEPYAIYKITDKDGTILFEREEPRDNRQVVAAQNVYQITTMMESVIQNGTGRAAAIPYPAAGKTGTSQEFRDAWFIGYTPRYAAAIWMGNDDNTPTKRLTGGSGPARVWRDTMIKAHEKSGGPTFNIFNRAGFGSSGFDDFLSRILGGDSLDGEESRARTWNRQGSGEPEEYTPLGRHQWDVNN
ncbi:MAG: PBP1A family penicillin-binding protein [Alphaproteobacteria bacterium]|nr:PBP1A family penicillin-binding protein [Alphaproteobacteria bacterium]NCQ88270.1 PBP1A family penicillin-binding protein [Alphaproteobacteria bacterium]NCT05223.1 PBP1A family penicillin-binding protein [Alphaproteobacteria bacterium]